METTPRSHMPAALAQPLNIGNLTQASPNPAPRLGDLCPRCQAGRLDYDGLLNLACPRCGYAFGGSCYT